MSLKLSSFVCFFGLFIIGIVKSEDESRISFNSDELKKNALADAVNDFGYKIMTKMINDNYDKNIALSPTGIAGLLAMSLLGSVGRSYDELAEALGFSQDVSINRQNHEMFGELLNDLNNNETASKTIFSDALFIEGKSNLREAYRSYLARVYRGDAIGVDFADKNTVKALINEWVSNMTKGKIPDFLKESLPADTRAVLLSALYFIGQWETPFVPEYTLKMNFTTPKNDVEVDMMLNLGNFKHVYSIEDGVHMVALPYNDSITTMYVLKPRRPDKQSINDLLNSLNYTRINKMIDEMCNRKAIIRFPKMDLKVHANLEGPLKQLGIQSIFIPNQANFALMIDGAKAVNKTEEELLTRINDGDRLSGIKDLKSVIDALPNPGVYVDSILHDVRITIDEYGTEAVAATSGILARTAETFYANTPFYMFIRNEKTKLVTFSAVVYDPTT
ncbi:serine protease inhibitor 13 precursor [Danaus plexippus plexippus]|uniref:Serine protease inhibitor 13 n=1 Tax=Danaus plexippus plexippus TaxID=278856 RepID=A0A212F3H3_DANPL|nr:serine protease inhibitor 13 precursor [Danaus plexippus plexippus]